MPRGQTRSGTAEAPWHLGGPDPPRQGEEQCVPQASPVPRLDSVTRHLRAQQHRAPLSAATSPLGTPTRGTATGCQRREVPGTASRTLGLCSPLVTWGTSSPTPGPSQQRMELRTVEEEQAPQLGHCLQLRESPVHPLPFPVHPISTNQAGQSCRWGFPVLWGPTMPSPLDTQPGNPWEWAPQHGGGSPSCLHALGDALSTSGA